MIVTARVITSCAIEERVRIKEQQTWYADKAAANAEASRKWLYGGIAIYCLAIILALSRISELEPKIWPIEPLIVLAASVVGWMQVKRFNELSSSYTLTALEIGLIQGGIQSVECERAFSDFVNEAEQAFSREHTQWVARQQSA